MSVAPLSPAPSVRRLADRWGAVGVWLPIVAVSVLHYAAPTDALALHDIARRLYYLPIVVAGTRGGPLGGVLAAVVVMLAYMPHAGGMEGAPDPGQDTEKMLEIAFYGVLGVVAGVISARAHAEQRRLADLALRLESTLEEVRQKDVALARASRLEALGHLSAGLAHEIRNPLHAMRGTAEILLDFVPKAAPERSLAQAHLAEIDRLAGVLTKFLAFARPRAPAIVQVAPGEVLQRVADLVHAQARQQETAIVLSKGPDTTLPADLEQIVQVLLGIVINALQALGRGGHVELGWSVTDGRTTFRVANDGPPIPAELIDRIFDPFVSTRADGTGLGLSTAWRIIEDHAGQLEAANLPAGGVEFRVTLPG